ncbi:MAG: hypothetical protein ABWW70_03585 [Thermoproteota archaeon]
MPVYYALKEPTSEREWNIYSLREAARHKKRLAGVYYSPKLRRLLAVFRATPGTHFNELVFERVEGRVIEDAYRMECPEGCNRCCVIHSGAFILDTEVRQLPEEARRVIDAQPSYIVRTPGGPVRVYRLDTESMGRCVFFDVERGVCRLEADYGREHKPIVCLLTYCTVFASRGGKLYLKVSARRRGGGYEMVYREVDEEEWRAAVERMSSIWRRYRKRVGAPPESRSASS